MYVMVVVALITLAGHEITTEYRMHPLPDLGICQELLKVRLDEMAASKQFPRRVTKAECEKLP